MHQPGVVTFLHSHATRTEVAVIGRDDSISWIWMSVCSRGSCRLTYGRSAHMPAGPKRWRQMGSGFHDPYLSVARRRRRAGAPRTHNAARVMRGRDVRKSDTTVATARTQE